MKKIQLWLAAASVMMMTAACSSEANEPVQPAQEKASVEFTVNLDGIESRANGDGTTADQLIFAVFDSEGNELAALRQNDVAVTGREATVKTSVARGQNYTFVFWAQKKVGENLNDNGFYNTTNLKDVVVSYAGYANDENRDAFTQVVALNNVTDDINQTVYLHRPFAQIDFICDLDEWKKLHSSNYKLIGSDLTIDGGAYTHLNPLTGEATQPTAVSDSFTLQLSDYYTKHNISTYDFCGFITSKTGTDQYQDLFTTESDDMFWLSMNYILATPEITKLPNAEMKIYAFGLPDKPVKVPVENLPIQRNHRTVVTVSNITKLVEVAFEIDPRTGGDINY
ncbi:MAG: hypothetical protein IJ775_05865 [Muribaculaceae bacterium]|nr:hypothetical protein [Muribaculaceae bacterium]